jgi:uncharacterized membrane protein
VTAECRDGSYSYSYDYSAACLADGGVLRWR